MGAVTGHPFRQDNPPGETQISQVPDRDLAPTRTLDPGRGPSQEHDQALSRDRFAVVD